MKLQPTLITALTLALTAPAYAQRTLVFQNDGVDQSKQIITVVDHLASMSFSETAEQRGRVVYDREQNKAFIIMEQRQQIMDVDAMAKMAGNMSDMMSGMLDKMPEEQKSKMQGMLGNLMKENAPQAARKPEEQLERTGKYSTVDNVKCEIVIMHHPQSEAEMCVAEPEAVGMSEKDFQTVNAMMHKMQSMSEQMTQMSGGGKQVTFASLDGIPVRSKQLSGPAAGQTSILIESSEEIDRTRTTIPQDYKLLDMSKMPY